MGAMASQITSPTIVYSTVSSGADQRKRQSSASLAFVRRIHRWPVNSPHKWPVTRKMCSFDDVIMEYCVCNIFLMKRAHYNKYSACSVTLLILIISLVKWWMSVNLSGNKSALVHVIAMCYQMGSPQWVNPIHLRTISQEMPLPSTAKFSLKITYLKCRWNRSAADKNEPMLLW